MTTDPVRGRAGAPAQAWTALRPAGLSHDVILPDSPAFHDALAQVVRGWPGSLRPVADPLPQDAPQRPLGRIGVFAEPDLPGQFLVASTYLDAPMRGLPMASALCALLADLSQSLVDETPGLRALHCGAFRRGDGLVAVTGRHRAGKSTLIARLTAEPGIEVFCDDVLPITDSGEGIALGVAPRLRLPLPANASDGFRAHVAAHLGPRDDRYGYLCAPALAVHGSHAPLRTLIVLDRQPDAALARLHHLDPGEAFQHLMARNLGLFDSADGAVAALEDLLAQLVCLRLVYSDLEQAVAVLGRAIRSDGRPDPTLPLAPARPFAPDTTQEVVAPVDPDSLWQQAAGVAIRRIGSNTVLWRPDGATVWQLNLVAHAVWELLAEEPASARALADLLSEIFADVDPARLLQDIRGLLAALAENDLVRPAR